MQGNVPFYFDHNATTPVDPLVLETFSETARQVYGNASSIHYFGQAAKQRLESARRSVARKLGASAREIVFTSGGTESDNLAILGCVRASNAGRKHVITTQIEHPAVLNACQELHREGVEITFLGVGSGCVVDPDDVKRELRPHTVLISAMHANNETGVIQPIEQLAEIAREAGVTFHSDGVQAAGRIDCDVNRLGVDLYSISAHKMKGLKGAGALFVRETTRVHPVLFGGHQERDRRPGTENIPAVAAFGVAAKLPRADTTELRDRLENGILGSVCGAHVNAAGSLRLPNTTNICFPGASGEAMIIALDLAGFAVSSGAACSSGSIEPSHVLLAMGQSEAEAKSSIRFSLGAGNTIEQVDALIQAVSRIAPVRVREKVYA
jgi:cysteine desulfurase